MRSYSWNIGATLGLLTSAYAVMVLSVVGAAGIWGFSDAAGVRDGRPGDLQVNEWTKATVATSGVLLFVVAHLFYANYADDVACEKVFVCREQAIQKGVGYAFGAGMHQGIVSSASVLRLMCSGYAHSEHSENSSEPYHAF